MFCFSFLLLVFKNGCKLFHSSLSHFKPCSITPSSQHKNSMVTVMLILPEMWFQLKIQHSLTSAGYFRWHIFSLCAQCLCNTNITSSSGDKQSVAHWCRDHCFLWEKKGSDVIGSETVAAGFYYKFMICNLS